MRVFFSGVTTKELEADPRLGSPRYRLFSAHDDYFKFAMQAIPLCASIDDDFEIMLDSGAFTAWTQGDKVELDDVLRAYGAIVSKYSDIVPQFWLINLDVIPGNKGRIATQEEITEALRVSDINYNALVKEFGEIVLPVFHMMEPEQRLADLCSMAKYVLISPRNDFPERHRMAWAHQVHDLIPDDVRTHGLGATGLNMMTDIPWHSVDSTSWIMSGSYGNIWLPGTMRVIAMSEDSPNRHKAGAHYQTLTPHERQLVDEFAERHGFQVEQLATDYNPRMLWNRVVQSEIYRAIPEGGRTKPRQDNLFGIGV